MTSIDLAPSARRLADLVAGVADDRLDDPTPCAGWAVADLLRHVGGLTVEFTSSAQKVPTPARAGDGLVGDWRQRIADDLAALADAWRSPEAYAGETHAGPVTLPGGMAARVALTEVTVHGWDLARATGQEYAADDATVAEVLRWVQEFDPPGKNDGVGLFGPVVPAGDGATMAHLLGLTGRDAAWTPTSCPTR